MTTVHRGPSKLLISIDVGATNSAVAWQYLQSDKVVPLPTNVAQWPGPQDGHRVKIPSSILYRNREAVKFGLDAEDEVDLGLGEHLIKNPKLVLHPDWMKDLASAPLKPLIPGEEPIRTFEMPDIPAHLPIAKIYKNFLEFLFTHTRRSFVQCNLGGMALWDSLIPAAQIIIGAPNGWSAREKGFLVDALLATSFCSSSKRENIHVVSEAEASLLYLLNTSSTVPLTTGALVTSCDCGGSTIDITLYECTDGDQMKFQEIGTPLCAQRGGLYVSRAMEAYIRQSFDRSVNFREEAALYTKQALLEFDTTLKTTWDGTSTEQQRIRFSRLFTDTEATAGIRNGKLAVAADTINNAFDSCVSHVIGCVKERIYDNQGRKSEAILLVGGFGDSPYLQRAMIDHFERSGTPGAPGIPVLVPSISGPGVKAVSAGAPWLFARRETVVARAALFSYGISVKPRYDNANPEHRSRTVKESEDGSKYVYGGFHRLINKGETSTSDDYKSSPRFTFEGESRAALSRISISLFMFIGDELPNFMTNKDGSWKTGFYKLGTIFGSGVRIPMRTCTKENGTHYYETDFKIGVSFGGLAIKARIENADGTEFGQEIEFRANSTLGLRDADQQQARSTFRPIRGGMRRFVKAG